MPETPFVMGHLRDVPETHPVVRLPAGRWEFRAWFTQSPPQRRLFGRFAVMRPTDDANPWCKLIIHDANWKNGNKRLGRAGTGQYDVDRALTCVSGHCLWHGFGDGHCLGDAPGHIEAELTGDLENLNIGKQNNDK